MAYYKHLHLCKSQNESARKIYHVSTADKGGLSSSSQKVHSKRLLRVC